MGPRADPGSRRVAGRRVVLSFLPMPLAFPGGALNMHELEQLARERLSSMAYDYYASGALDEHTLRDNVAAWSRLALHYRVLVDVGRATRRPPCSARGCRCPSSWPPRPSTSSRAPRAKPRRRARRRRAGTVMVLSSLSNTSVEDVCAAATGRVWFQLYVYRDRGATAALVARAQAAGAGRSW